MSSNSYNSGFLHTDIPATSQQIKRPSSTVDNQLDPTWNSRKCVKSYGSSWDKELSERDDMQCLHKFVIFQGKDPGKVANLMLGSNMIMLKT